MCLKLCCYVYSCFQISCLSGESNFLSLYFTILTAFKSDLSDITVGYTILFVVFLHMFTKQMGGDMTLSLSLSLWVWRAGSREECLQNKELELGAWQVARSHSWSSCLRTKGDPEPIGHSQGSWGQLAFGCCRKRWWQQGPEVPHRLSTQGALHWMKCPFHIAHHPGSGLLSVIFNGAWIPQGLSYSCISPGKTCILQDTSRHH